MNTISRKNSFGRELGGEQGGGGAGGGPSNPTPTFCTLPRDSKACEVRDNGGMQSSLISVLPYKSVQEEMSLSIKYKVMS